MLWPVAFILALGAAVVFHLAWRAKARREMQDLRRKIESLGRESQNTSARMQRQEEALFDSMAEGLLLLDRHGRIELANRAFTSLFGVTTDIRSRTLMEALRLHELADLVDFLGREKQVVGYEVHVSRPTERWLQVNGAAVFDPDGERHGTILVFHDLTRLKNLEDTRKEFVANVSHELRTPLSLIKGYVETLLDGAMDNPKVSTKFLQTIQRNAERLRLLIEDLLVISELESGRVKLDLQPVELAPLVQKVLDDFKTRAEPRKMHLRNECPEVTVRADPARLEQVLGNLIDNAIKYGRAEGTIAVGVGQQTTAEVTVTVRDDGPGIPTASLARLFERFYRVDKARSREAGGTGLGLAIVKHIVQGHGGRVWAESKLGEGATFHFTLPRDSGALQRPLF